jgi:hypothetical protein
MMFFWLRGTAAIAFSVLCSWAYAITPADIDRLQVGSQLELPSVNVDTDAMVNMTVESVTHFINADGYSWHRFDGKTSDGKPASLVVNVDKDKVEVESAITRMRLHDLGVNAKAIWNIDKLSQGEIVFESQHYKFNADESEDIQFSKDKSASTAASYYRFESAEDDDLALLVFEWADDKFEVLQLEWVDAEKVQLK